jgi:hypothetical protein
VADLRDRVVEAAREFSDAYSDFHHAFQSHLEIYGSGLGKTSEKVAKANVRLVNASFELHKALNALDEARAVAIHGKN